MTRQRRQLAPPSRPPSSDHAAAESGFRGGRAPRSIVKCQVESQCRRHFKYSDLAAMPLTENCFHTYYASIFHQISFAISLMRHLWTNNTLLDRLLQLTNKLCYKFTFRI